jgi:hypothetical protein
MTEPVQRRVRASSLALVAIAASAAILMILFTGGPPIALCLAGSGTDPIGQAECARQWAESLQGIDRLWYEDPALVQGGIGAVMFVCVLAAGLAIRRAARR